MGPGDPGKGIPGNRLCKLGHAYVMWRRSIVEDRESRPGALWARVVTEIKEEVRSSADRGDAAQRVAGGVWDGS